MQLELEQSLGTAGAVRPALDRGQRAADRRRISDANAPHAGPARRPAPDRLPRGTSFGLLNGSTRHPAERAERQGRRAAAERGRTERAARSGRGALARRRLLGAQTGGRGAGRRPARADRARRRQQRLGVVGAGRRLRTSLLVFGADGQPHAVKTSWPGRVRDRLARGLPGRDAGGRPPARRAPAYSVVAAGIVRGDGRTADRPHRADRARRAAPACRSRWRGRASSTVAVLSATTGDGATASPSRPSAGTMTIDDGSGRRRHDRRGGRALPVPRALGRRVVAGADRHRMAGAGRQGGRGRRAARAAVACRQPGHPQGARPPSSPPIATRGRCRRGGRSPECLGP